MVANSDTGYNAVSTGRFPDSKGNTVRESGPSNNRSGSGTNRSTSLVPSQTSTAYRIRTRLYSAATAIGFALFGVIEFITTRK